MPGALARGLFPQRYPGRLRALVHRAIGARTKREPAMTERTIISATIDWEGITLLINYEPNWLSLGERPR